MAHEEIKGSLRVAEETGRISFAIALTLLGGMLLLCAVVAKFLFPAGPGEGLENDYAQILAMIATILLGTPLIWTALKDLWVGHMHMNELVALAVLAAFAMGWYLEAGFVAFFTIISVLIENRTALGAQASIESLMRITPTKATKLTSNDAGEVEETVVDASQLSPGDTVRVRPGDNIPADGVILKGESTVNQASITGESLPADKLVGDEVFSGTINLTGALEIEVTKAGEDTTLGRVKDLIMQAESTRMPFTRLIDRYAGWYTPTVLMIVFIVWFFISQFNPESAASRAIAMLVIACPCPLILATPTAIVAALSAASRLGVYVKNVNDLEKARNLTAMVFDKTGTLTTGELQVTRLAPTEGVEGADLLATAASVEQNSRHPVARAVAAVARKARLTLHDTDQFEEVAGKGVAGTLEGDRVLVGRPTWVVEQLNDAGERAKVDEALDEADEQGLSTLSVARGGKLLGWIGLADNARPEAAAAMDDLREMGLKRLIIVTGDRESVAQRVAAQMHTEYKAEVLPQQKLDMVDDLKSKGHHVAVIGDGVNDAPALAAGDISIAMGAAGSDVAVQSASIALMNSNLNRIPFLVRLSRVTSGVIRQNMAIGFGFIIVFGAIFAAGGVEKSAPILAAVLHLVSSLLVVFNSARLVRSGEDIEQAEAEVAGTVNPRQTGRQRGAATAKPAVA